MPHDTPKIFPEKLGDLVEKTLLRLAVSNNEEIEHAVDYIAHLVKNLSDKSWLLELWCDCARELETANLKYIALTSVMVGLQDFPYLKSQERLFTLMGKGLNKRNLKEELKTQCREFEESMKGDLYE